MTAHTRLVAICVLNTSISGPSEPWDRGMISDRAGELGYRCPRVIDLAYTTVEALLCACSELGAVAVVVPSLDHLPVGALEGLDDAGLTVATVYPPIARHVTGKPEH